ncbi:MAG: peptide deformylase [Lentisphaeria bacterium]|nr:peptide deformylase [Lentisphaeria bacterium]
MLKPRFKHPVITFGAPVLRERAQAIPAITAEIRALAADMARAMHFYDGIGIAAPQVGVSKRLVVFDVPFPEERDDLSPGEAALLPLMPLAVVNPEIIAASSASAERDEGCLSVPGIFAPVARPERVVLRAMLLDGGIIEYECGGLLGRCVQHELDHLDGTLFTDRVVPAARPEIAGPLAQLEESGRKRGFRR